MILNTLIAATITSKDINTILDNLKPTKLNKNNMVISSDDVQKLKNYTKDVQSIYCNKFTFMII